jgi:hypothetical protein
MMRLEVYWTGIGRVDKKIGNQEISHVRQRN